MTAKALGAQGEELACRHLEANGYTIVARNMHSRYGEIDIIAEKNGCYVFVEVKTRSSERFARPSDAVSPAKRMKLIKTAALWLSEDKRDEYPARFDVIEVLPGLSDNIPRIHHIMDAFDASER